MSISVFGNTITVSVEEDFDFEDFFGEISDKVFKKEAANRGIKLSEDSLVIQKTLKEQMCDRYQLGYHCSPNELVQKIEDELCK